MTKDNYRAFNFNAGPSALPLDVLEKAKSELTDFQETGMSIMELSHRSPEYEALHNEAIRKLKELYAIPDDYKVLFLQGGASTQFAMVPMNFLQGTDKKAGYIMTGSWSKKALVETALFGNAYEAASSKSDEFRFIPAVSKADMNNDDAYVHLTSNNTIYGTQWQHFPDTGQVPLIADMSSDIMSRPVDISKFDLIYAGAQKNLGPSGVTIAIIKENLLEKTSSKVPTMFNYQTHVDKNSLYNTPPTFGIYMIGKVLNWIDQQGGLETIAEKNKRKAGYIYDTIDASNGFYTGHAHKESRSNMNITFRLQSEALEKEFLTEAKNAGFTGLNGHRSVGGCRASTYNAVPEETCRQLSDFMQQFQRKHHSI